MNMKDVAREAGVSVMTVSRALRNDPKVALALRLRIQELARRLGYRPNPLVSVLMSQRRSGKPEHHDLKLGFVTSFSTRDGWKKFRLYREFYAGAAQSAEAHGYSLEEFWLAEPGMTPERLSQVLLTRNVRGVLLAPLPVPQGRMDLNWENLSAVGFGYSVAEPDLHRISNHQFRSMRLLMLKLRELGYQRPGLALSQSLDGRVLHQWLGSFLVAQKDVPGRHVPLFIIPDQQWSQARFTKWLERHQPDVVIGQQQDLLEWIQQSGRAVPEDVGFAHLDCPAVSGNLSGLYQNGPEIGVAATDTLVAMLNRNERGVPAMPRTLLIEGVWAQGKTTRQTRG
jgi:LacI family transcriptional regulator